MQTSFHLLMHRRFLPLFVTQLLGAFNDNLFKNAVILFVVYGVYNSEKAETLFSGVATAMFIIPFILLSATAGQLADSRDKAAIIRIVKLAEIIIMLVGGTGLFLAWSGQWVESVAVPLMLVALGAMGIHSTFFGPIKYAILPQHLRSHEVLGGTGLVEAGTYIAVLAGTILAGLIEVEFAALICVLVAAIGYFSGRRVPAAPPMEGAPVVDWHIVRASIALVRSTMHIRRLFLAILAISVFWSIGTILLIQFPPLVKNVLTASKPVASLFLAVFSIGIALGSVSINRLLGGKVSARYAPASVLVMGVFVLGFYALCRDWATAPTGQLYTLMAFLRHDMAIPLLLSLLGIATAGGMFVVPLYAFLTTTVDKSAAARTVATNNIVNCIGMAISAIAALGMTYANVPVVEQLWLSFALCLLTAWLAWRLYRAEDAN